MISNRSTEVRFSFSWSLCCLLWLIALIFFRLAFIGISAIWCISSFLFFFGFFLLHLFEIFFGKFSVSCPLLFALLLVSCRLITWFASVSLSGVHRVRKDAHTLGLSVWDEVHDRQIVYKGHFVNIVKTATLKLNVATLRQSLDNTFSDSNLIKL